ncbi:hypothetical protein NSP_51720 [Nodularia spumigena CCY9414]|nr:hypothetical protein NSP_51720 [Nodularia spumigena CCY9414]
MTGIATFDYGQLQFYEIKCKDWINNLYCPVQDLGGNFQITETEF